MWPFKRKLDQFERELAAVKALPDVADSPVQLPLVTQHDVRALAPPPMIDRFPVVIGQNLTGAYVSSAFRLANSGWRYQLVDLLDELLENDPATRGKVRARVLGVASARYAVQPGDLGEGASEQERDVAKAVADEFALDYANIPCRTQRIQQLAWADWYGVMALENFWAKGGRWELTDTSFLHSRRLNYTNPYSWKLFVWDQGLTPGASEQRVGTSTTYGIRVADYPGKFIVHTPSLSGQYPTRDGEGRYVAFAMLLIRLIIRSSAQDFERVIRPWVLGYFNRALKENQESPVADQDDITSLEAALAALGAGSLNSAALPNTVKVELLRAASAMSAIEFVRYLGNSISIALLGQAFTIEPGANGNFGTAQTADKNTQKILEYSAGALCDTQRRDWATVWTRLNHPALPRKYVPRITFNATDLPSAKELMDMAKIGTEIGMPIEIRDLGDRTFLKTVAAEDEITPRTKLVKAEAASTGTANTPATQPTPELHAVDSSKGKLLPMKAKPPDA